VYAVGATGTTRYTAQHGLPGGLTQCVLPDHTGVVWACLERGLARIDPANPSHPVQSFHASDGMASDGVRAICEAADGALWIGGETPRVTVRRNGVFQILNLDGLPQVASIRSLLCDGDTIWAGTSFGLVRIRDGQQRLYTARDGLVDDFVFSVTKGPSDTLWIGTRNGFSRLRHETWDSFRPQDGLSQSTAQALLEDREGNLWVGTKRGLNQFTDGRSVPYSASEGLPSNQTGPVFQDQAGVIWAGTLDAGLARFDGRRFVSAATGLPSNTVRALMEDADRGLWVGTSNGLVRIHSGRITARFDRASGLPSNDVRSLFRDRDGVLWAGTSAGLASYTGGRWTASLTAPRREIRSIGQDREGAIVIGIEEGLYISQDDIFRPLTRSGIYMRNANAFFLDRDGLLWVGLNGAGLLLIDGEKITSFITRDGLYDAEIYGLSVDDQDRMWMACSRGMFWISRAELRRYAAGEIMHVTSSAYSPTEAQRVIEGRAGVQPALWRMRDGRMWFSTVRGLIAVDPQQPGRAGAPPIVIEDPIVNGAPTPPGLIASLPGGQKNVTFDYAGLSYEQPELIRFRYRLDGYDAGWVDAGTRREAFYTNLPPGDYKFQVTGCNFDGPCNESGASVVFTLTPQIYQRAWFWPLVLAALGVGGWAGYRLRIRRLSERYDLIVSERSRIARELHDTLIQGFSGITMGLHALTARIKTPEERATLEDIIADAATCLRETRQSVAGLRALPGLETGLAAALNRAVREITDTKHLRTHFDLDPVSHPLPPESEYQVLRIVREAVSNAVKHSDATELHVALKQQNRVVRITIQDDGRGFTRDAAADPGHYGIIGMQERASQIGGALDLVTQPGSGTIITLTLPALELKK
jgi:ligand-binding sensor domain-containing protein